MKDNNFQRADNGTRIYRHDAVWLGQRDSLAIHLYSREVAFQKLKYIHNNPLAEHWQLAKHPCDYKYSSAGYYELNENNFSFLKDLWEVF